MTPPRSPRTGTPSEGDTRATSAKAQERGIPEATVARLPVYLRALISLSERGTATCSSEELATAAGVNSAKLRKDLSYLGSYGTRGVGYDVEYLRYQIAREIGVTQDWPVVIVGIGNLGHALANYSGFSSRGFRIVALLDADPAAAGRGRRRARHPGLRRDRVAGRGARRRHRGHRDPGAGRAGRVRPARRGGRDQHPELRAGRARGARRGRRTQGGPVHRAADPGLPRAAQVAGRPGRRPPSWTGRSAHERPGGGGLPQDRAGRGPRAARGRRRRRGQAGARRRRLRARARGDRADHLQPHRGLRRRGPLPRQRRGRVPAALRARRRGARGRGALPVRALRRRRRLAPVPRRRGPRLDGRRGEPDPRPDP